MPADEHEYRQQLDELRDAAIENTYSASTATDNTAQDAAITGCSMCEPSRTKPAVMRLLDMMLCF